ncbi:hypothetical protein Hypma_001647 [Hypsizygus marmoreus]|uniref:Uncharacterized protein n=1 Tax=Hypsizygus marmoreus TaxID=39966 RepID=A0A369J849_HYPMA|nr:hypothetical protein Hypma_001647 [Hypsizygus marmoreus]
MHSRLQQRLQRCPLPPVPLQADAIRLHQPWMHLGCMRNGPTFGLVPAPDQGWSTFINLDWVFLAFFNVDQAIWTAAGVLLQDSSSKYHHLVKLRGIKHLVFSFPPIDQCLHSADRPSLRQLASSYPPSSPPTRNAVTALTFAPPRTGAPRP